MLTELSLYWGTGLYLVFAVFSFMAFMMISIKRGWLMRLLLLPTIVFPFFYVFFYFSQNLPDGNNDGWLTYFVRSHDDPRLLDLYNRIPDLIFGNAFLIPLYFPAFLVLIFAAAILVDFKPFAGKSVPRKQSFKELKLFALALLATFAFHLHQYDPYSNFYFLNKLSPIQQTSNVKNEYAYLAAINDPLLVLNDADRTVADFKRDLARNADKITVLSSFRLRFNQTPIYRAQKMPNKDPKIEAFAQEYIDAIIAFYPLAVDIEKHSRRPNSDDLRFIRDNQQAYIGNILKLKWLENRLIFAIPPVFLEITRNYKASLADDDEKQLPLALIEDMLSLTVLIDKGIQTQLSDDEIEKFKQIAAQMQKHYNWRWQSLSPKQKDIDGNNHYDSSVFFRRIPDYINMLKNFPQRREDIFSLTVARDSLMGNVRMLNSREPFTKR